MGKETKRETVLAELLEIGKSVAKEEVNKYGFNPVLTALAEFAIDAGIKAVLGALDTDKVEILMKDGSKAAATVDWGVNSTADGIGS